MKKVCSVAGMPLLALLASLAFAGQAFACSCFSTGYTSDEAELKKLRQQDLIAEGRITTITSLHTLEECRAAESDLQKLCGPDSDASCGQPLQAKLYECQGDMIAEVELTTIWKGSFRPKINARFSRDTGGNCGLNLDAGSILLIETETDATQTVHLSTCNTVSSEWITSSHAAKTRGVWERYRGEWQTLLDAVAEAPADSSRLWALAEFLETNNDRLGALDSYRRLIALLPDDPQTHAGAARASYALERFADAVAFANAAHDLSPSDAEIEILYRRAQFQAGESIDPSLVDFRGMKLAIRNLDAANLAGKDFSDAELENVSFRGAMLDRANFANALVNTVDFSNASLRQADFRFNSVPVWREPLMASQFQGADLSGARFDGITLSIHSTWDGAGDASALAAANLAGAHLSCDGLSQSDLIAVSPAELEPLWQKHMSDMRLIDNLRTQQPAVIVEADCATVVNDYLALPPTCRPWRLEASTHPYCGLPQ
ncbi:MAG: pentapeptide repeat-containing protein [Rhodospirillaceae bacterium]|nr:pentapeptide repeat-containing protein [Rhodospirillaceae bacterium]